MNFTREQLLALNHVPTFDVDKFNQDYTDFVGLFAPSERMRLFELLPEAFEIATAIAVAFANEQRTDHHFVRLRSQRPVIMAAAWNLFNMFTLKHNMWFMALCHRQIGWPVCEFYAKEK